jgi:gas vesicle protein
MRAIRALTEFAVGVLAGIAAGYATALLLAPSEGDEARQRVRQSAEAMKEAPGQVAEEVQVRVQRAVDQGRKAAEDARAELESAAGFKSGEWPADIPSSSGAI